MRSHRPYHLAWLAAGAAALLPATAQEIALPPAPTVVVTATRLPQTLADVPAAVDVVDMASVQAQMRVNASEALVRVPGLVALNRQNYAQDLQVSSRGFGARAAFGVRGVRLLADGIPASSPDGQGQAATFNLDLAERIEVLRGPFSALYGNHAGGVVQLFTRDGEGAPSATFSASGASYGARKLGISAEGRPGTLGYVLDASRFQTDGYREHSAAVREQAFAKLTPTLRGGRRLVITASGLRQDDTQDPLGVKWATFERDPRVGEIDMTDTQVPQRSFAQRYNTRKDIGHQQGGASFESPLWRGRVRATAYAGNRSVVQYQSFSRGFQSSPAHSGGVVDFERSFHGLDVNGDISWVAGPGWLTAIAGVAAERSRDDRKGYENFVGDQLGVRGRLRRDEDDLVRSVDPYVQLEWRSGRWVAHTGLRRTRLSVRVDDRYLDNGDDSGSVVFSRSTPVAGVVFKATPGVSVYASAARGFEAPTLNELFYSNEGGFNFGLRSASSSHLEAGVKGKTSAGIHYQAAAFQVRTRDELVVDASTGGRTSYRNAAGTVRKGVEVSARGPLFSRDVSFVLAASTLSARYAGAFGSAMPGNRIPGTPAAHGYAELAWANAPRSLEAAVEAQASARLYVEDSNAERPAPGYAVANLRASMAQDAGSWVFREFIRLNNLFDRRYVGSVIVGESSRRYYEAAPGRNWSAGFSATGRF